MNQTISFNKKAIYILASIYIFSLMMFDYTILYRISFIMLFLGELLLFKKKKVRFSPIFIMYLVLILFFTIHTFLGYSIDKSLSVSYLETMLMNLFIIYAFDGIINNKEDIDKILKIYIISSFIVCLYVIIVDSQNLFTGHLGSGALKPFFNMPYAHNDVSMSAAYAVMFLSYFSLSKRKHKYSFPLKLFFSFFVLLTGARKSLILIIFALIIYPLLFSDRDKDIIKKIMNLLICVLGILIAFFIIMKNESLYNIIGYRFEGFFNGLASGGTYTESSAVSRSVMLNTAISLFFNKPFVGYGLNTFRTFKGSYGTWSHNNYLELAVSGGILAPIIFYGLFIYIFIKLIKNKKDIMNGMFYTLMIFMLIHDFLSISYISRMVLLIIGLICSYIKVDYEEVKK